MSMDQVDADTLMEMRCYAATQGGVSWDEAQQWSDAEVLDRIDGGYPGGSAQFNREERDWSGEDWNKLPRSDERLLGC